jgi:hypothetical protein
MPPKAKKIADLLKEAKFNFTVTKQVEYTKKLSDQEYNTIDQLKDASLEALTLCGLKVADAQALYDHFHPKRDRDEGVESTKKVKPNDPWDDGDPALFDEIKKCNVKKPKSGELTVVQLSRSWFTETSDTLFVRECYDKLYTEAMKCFVSGGGVIALGNPGVGKSWFLNYVLVRLLKETTYEVVFDVPSMDPELHYFKGGKVFVVAERKAFYRRIAQDANIVRLRDFDHDHNEGVTKIKGFSICASSPNPSNYKQALKNFQGLESGGIEYVGTWGAQELSFANGIRAIPFAKAVFDERFKWTRAPRYFFLQTRHWKSHIKSVTASANMFDIDTFETFRKACCGEDVVGAQLSHKVITITPSGDIDDCVIDFMTPAIKEVVLNNLKLQSADERKKLFNHLMGVDIGHTLAGHMFENFLHGFLPTNMDGKTTALGHIKAVPSLGKKKFTENVFEDAMPSPLVLNVYYRPLIPNFACIDSFAIHSSGDVVAHQHTVGKNHSIKADKLIALLKVLKVDGTTAKSLHIVFVVPTDVSSCTTLQTYAGIQKLSQTNQQLIRTQVFQYRREVKFE